MSSIWLIAAAMTAAPPAQSAQAAFDAAGKAAMEGRCEEAITAYDRLATVPAARNPVVKATIAVRRGMCLDRLDRSAEAEESLRAGVEILAAQPVELRLEARDAYLALSRLAEERDDYDTGLVAAQRALDLSTGDERSVPLSALAKLTRFDGDGKAIAYAEETLRIVEARPDLKKEDLARAQTFVAQVLLNAGRTEDAYKLLKRALANNGGLTTRSSLSDVATRYDLAQAALLTKRPDDAKLYLAYTGAGRASETPFARAEQLDLPACGSTPGMTPDSYAVVEFSLGEDGRVLRAEPVFAKGDRATALAFAAAVRDWSWSPERAAAIPAFYRSLTRVELRCTNAGDRSGVMAPLDTAVAAWMEGAGVAATPAGASEARMLPVWRGAAGGSGAAALDANLRIVTAATSTRAESIVAAARARALAETLDAPPPVRTRAEILAIDVGNGAALKSRGDWTREMRRRVAAMQALLERPAIATDPMSAATLRLRLSGAMAEAAGASDGERNALLDAVIAAGGLPAHHPLKVNALLARANGAAAAGDLAAAAALFERTGLDEQQCALIGPRPAVSRSGASSSLYPTDAIRMGFEGWTQIEFDIAADGRTASPRAVIAYPPFVFGDAAKEMIARTRYEASYRPSQGTACAANRQNFSFGLPK